jgi:nucleotide-binding universal stress UspA family protein
MSIKFEKILCPVEFEQNSAAALRFAGKLADPDSRLYLLHVLPEGVRPGTELPPSTLELARECLENFALEQPAGDVKLELLVRSGDPADIIVKVANELMADIIVMATHGHKGFARLLLGSVAERVVREARPPVLTLRPEITVQPKSA